MFIERVQVEEGFLDGLDLALSPGLNVVIGARGTGKTSLIELIRFCLHAPTFTEDARARSEQQAISVLGGGVVTLTLSDGVQGYTVSRQAADDSPPDLAPIRATVLAQNEIEAVGAQESGRMHLLDRCRTEDPDEGRAAARVRSTLRSLTAEIRDLLAEIAHLESRAENLAAVPDELAPAVAAQAAALATAEASGQQQKELAELQHRAEGLAARVSLYAQSQTQLEALRQVVADAVPSGDPVETWPPIAGPEDQLASARKKVSLSLDFLHRAITALDEALHEVSEGLSRTQRARSENETQARELRAKLNQLQEGVGALTRRVDELRERQAQLLTLREQTESRRVRLATLWASRSDAFEVLDSLRKRRFLDRQAVAKRLNADLGPTIKLDLLRSGRTSAYAAAIQGGLRGSGLHYNALAPLLAKEMSPLELVMATEAREPRAISDAAGIPYDRAASIVAHLITGDTPEIISAPIEDSVAFQLLDGSEYKPTERLSIGQRCTVVLPVLLAQPGDLLVIDQPEDHLDNAFVASVLADQLRRRPGGQQILLSSHNPNIPVLGEADLVVQLESDGRRGFVVHAGPLDDPGTVRAVTTVLEGGAEAFARRAAFYGDAVREPNASG